MGLNDYTRAAFALGYASCGPDAFPMTERAILGCDLLEQCTTATLDLIEVTRNIGRLEGLHAVIYRRREALVGKHSTVLAALLSQLAADVGLAHLVSSALAALGAPGTLSVAEAKAIIQPLLTAKVTDDWAAAAVDAFVDASVEGAAQAEALSTLVNQVVQISWDDLRTSAEQSLGNLADVWSGADAWVSDQISGLAGDIARAVVDGINNSASPDELQTAVGSVIGADDNGAQFYLSHAVNTAVNLAANNYYSQAGLNVNFVTVGDEKVDEECMDLESENPYSSDEVPIPPVHGECRCWLEPEAAEAAA